MGTLSLTSAADIADVTYEEFKQSYNSGTNIAAAYYAAIKTAADNANQDVTSNYATMATGVVENNTDTGKVANAYSEEVADQNSVPFSVGSDNWLRAQYEIMQNDLTARQTSIATGGTGELGVEETNQIHEDAFDVVGLPPETYSLYVPTNNLFNIYPDLAQAVFEAMLAEEAGGNDMFWDGMAIDVANYGAGAVDGDYYEWLYNMAKAIASEPRTC